MKKISIIAVILLNCFVMYAQSSADKIVGVWLPDSKEGKIEIYKKGDKYFGKMIWLKNPNGANGKPKLDIKNPDLNLRNQPVIGATMLKDFVYAGENLWNEGKIYDSRSGKTYSCKMTLDGNVLKVRGYIGVSLLGQTSVWTRVTP